MQKLRLYPSSKPRSSEVHPIVGQSATLKASAPELYRVAPPPERQKQDGPYAFALSPEPGYSKGMAKVKSIDPFVSSEPAVEISPGTSRILKERVKTADEGRVVSAEEARYRIRQWLSKSSTTKTR